MSFISEDYGAARIFMSLSMGNLTRVDRWIDWCYPSGIYSTHLSREEIDVDRSTGLDEPLLTEDSLTKDELSNMQMIEAALQSDIKILLVAFGRKIM